MSSTLLRTGAAVAACATLGSVASRDVGSAWYRGLSKPAFQPPPVAFPIAWTTLYADLALTSARALDAPHELDAGERDAYVRALAVNLVLNAGWSWVFFKAHRLDAAVVVAGALTASGVDLVRRTWRADPRAGAALAVYPGWCAFATVLSTALWRRNRG